MDRVEARRKLLQKDISFISGFQQKNSSESRDFALIYKILQNLKDEVTKVEAPFSCTTGYHCCHCRFWTVLEKEMKKHLLEEQFNKLHFCSTVTYGHVQNYVCDFCGMKTKQLEKLELHRQIAHQVGYCICLVCDLQCSDYKHLLRHLKCHYTNDDWYF